MSNEYIYNDIGYMHAAMHRRVVEFDPRNSDNPIILDYFNEIDANKNNNNLIYNVINEERRGIVESNKTLPISFTTVWYDISMHWVDIIHQMIFTDNAYATFVGEYKDVLENVIIYDNATEKENLVYRYTDTGDTIFHVAAKIWLYRKYTDSINGSINININKELKYIIECYEELEWYFGDNRRYCILYLMDVNNTTLIDSLTEFVSSLVG